VRQVQRVRRAVCRCAAWYTLSGAYPCIAPCAAAQRGEESRTHLGVCLIPGRYNREGGVKPGMGAFPVTYTPCTVHQRSSRALSAWLCPSSCPGASCPCSTASTEAWACVRSRSSAASTSAHVGRSRARACCSSRAKRWARVRFMLGAASLCYPAPCALLFEGLLE
jgi:hypothetical protein